MHLAELGFSTHGRDPQPSPGFDNPQPDDFTTGAQPEEVFSWIFGTTTLFFLTVFGLLIKLFGRVLFAFCRDYLGQVITCRRLQFNLVYTARHGDNLVTDIAIGINTREIRDIEMETQPTTNALPITTTDDRSETSSDAGSFHSLGPVFQG